jgi:hypothetical protein
MTIHTVSQLRKKLPAFKTFLEARGAELLEPTNEWEVVRFRVAHATAIIYTNAKGGITADGVALAALNSFVCGDGRWTAGISTPRQKVNRRSVDIRSLLARDGDTCFLCCLPLGEDMTVEHLVPLVHGGTHHIANKALAHRVCNLLMGHLSLMEKIRLREHYQNKGAKQ